MESAVAEIKNILLAEDDDDDFFILNSALLSISNTINIVRTKNGVMLTSLLETNLRPDLIILDLNMPFKNGTLILQEIKSNPELAGIRLIIYSTSSGRRDIDKCFDSGADFYLVKPVAFKNTIQQFADLFKNFYFINHQKPPREQFVLDYN